MGFILFVLLVLLLLGAIPWGSYHRYGYYPSGVLGLVLIVLLLLMVFGAVPFWFGPSVPP